MDTNENPATPTTAETVPEAAAPQTEPTPPMPTEAAPTAPQTAPVPPKKKGVPVVLIIILCVLVVFVVFIALVMGGGMALYEGFGGDTQAKAKQYLENKYGSDQGFSEGVLSGGSMFETGSVEYEFSSIKGGKNFYVAYSNDRGFSDNYYWVLYEKEFKDIIRTNNFSFSDESKLVKWYNKAKQDGAMSVAHFKLVCVVCDIIKENHILYFQRSICPHIDRETWKWINVRC